MKFVVDLSSFEFSDASKLTRIPLAILGRWFKGNVQFTITRETVATMVENFKKRRADIVMDYEHASERPDLAAGGPIPAAGWLKEIEPAPDERGIVWGLVELTDRARALIARLEYKYISPVINWGTRDKTSGEPQGATLQSIALTNRPFLHAMPSIQLSEAGGEFITEVRGMKENMKTELREINGQIERAIRDKMAANQGMNYGAASRAVMLSERVDLVKSKYELQRQIDQPEQANQKLIASELQTVREQIESKVRAKMRKNPDITYGQGLKMLMRDNDPILQRQYRLIDLTDRNPNPGLANGDLEVRQAKQSEQLRGASRQMEQGEKRDAEIIAKIQSFIMETIQEEQGPGGDQVKGYRKFHDSHYEVVVAQRALCDRFGRREEQARTYIRDNDGGMVELPDPADALLEKALSMNPGLAAKFGRGRVA